MTADLGILGRLQDKGQRIEDVDHVAPVASPLARLGGGASTGDLSLLGTRAPHRKKVSSCSADSAAIFSTGSQSGNTPLSFRHNDRIPSQNGKERCFLSPFADRAIPAERSSEAEISKNTQADTRIPIGRSKLGNPESEYDLGFDHSKALLPSKKSSSARTVNIKNSNHQPGSPNGWISPNSTFFPTRTLFIGNLSSDADKSSVEDLFAPYGDVSGVRIPTDSETGKHKGFGYVEFVTTGEATAALNKAQGTYLKGRQLHLDLSQTIIHPRNQQELDSTSSSELRGQLQPSNQYTNPENTTVFVSNLSVYVTEDELRSFFVGFGEIIYVKIPLGKDCGFVRFVQRQAAEMSINQMQGYPIGSTRISLSWARRHHDPSHEVDEGQKGSQREGTHEDYKDIVLVPAEAIGRSIGRGGETIKQMQNDTGCKIHVAPASGRDTERAIGLSVSRGAIEAAKRAIRSKVDAMEARNRPLEELVETFKEVPPGARDPRFGVSTVQCIFCHKQVRNTTGSRRKHLLGCQTYLQLDQRRITELDLPQLRKESSPQADRPSQIFMHYTISEDHCGDGETLRGSILARLGTRYETKTA